jgi:hypothetical protein
MLKRIVVAVALLVPAVGLAEEPQHVGMPRMSPFVDFRLGIGVPIVGTVAGFVQQVSPIPQLAAGIRLVDRVQLGVGFSFFRFATTNGMTDAAFNIFYFTPGVAIDIAKSRDNRVAFYGKFALALGAEVQTQTLFPASNGFDVGYDLTLGVRYLFHSAFALGFEGGVLGFFLHPERDNNYGITTFYSSLVGTFYFSGR